MRVSLRHGNRLVSQEALDLVEIHVCLHHARCKRVPHVMEPEVPDPRARDRTA